MPLSESLLRRRRKFGPSFNIDCLGITNTSSKTLGWEAGQILYRSISVKSEWPDDWDNLKVDFFGRLGSTADKLTCRFWQKYTQNLPIAPMKTAEHPEYTLKFMFILMRSSFRHRLPSYRNSQFPSWDRVWLYKWVLVFGHLCWTENYYGWSRHYWFQIQRLPYRLYSEYS